MAARCELAVVEDLRRIDAQLRETRSVSPTARGAPTTPRSWPRARPTGRHWGRSSARSATPSSPASAQTHGAEQIRSGTREAIGERLCNQRGRITPQKTGSSGKPPPGPATTLRPAATRPANPLDTKRHSIRAATNLLLAFNLDTPIGLFYTAGRKPSACRGEIKGNHRIRGSVGEQHRSPTRTRSLARLSNRECLCC
jgi:hypothetical protein